LTPYQDWRIFCAIEILVRNYSKVYDVDSRLDELAGLLQESNYRLTPQRLAVVRALIEDDEHPSAETVYGRIRATLPTTSLATVYNTLEALREIGQVLEVRPGQGPVRYDVRQPHRHSHLLCTRCGRVEDAPLSGEPARPEVQVQGWRELDVRLDFQGVCPECREAGDE
jgi:Fur family peroxide stress response transcriptional regulator